MKEVINVLIRPVVISVYKFTWRDNVKLGLVTHIKRIDLMAPHCGKGTRKTKATTTATTKI